MLRTRDPLAGRLAACLCFVGATWSCAESSQRSMIAFVFSTALERTIELATFRILAEGDPDVDAALASAVGCSPPPRSLTPPRPPLSDQRSRAARGCGAPQIVRQGKGDRVS